MRRARSIGRFTGAVLTLLLVAGDGCRSGEHAGGRMGGLFRRRTEPWTIECLSLRGPERRAGAEAVGDVLRKTPGIRADKVRVRHEPDVSTVYYATYYRKIDRRAGTREIPKALRDDLMMIKELVDDRGRRIFLGARMVPKPMPVADRAEWDLRNADGLYTLQVAAFFTTPDVPNYRQAAVDYTARLRRKGYEAYYYHGDANSIVTVGTFGDEALVKRDGVIGYSDQVRALQSKENFAYNVTNGQIWRQIVNGRSAPVRSRLVRIPRREENVP